MARKVSSNPSAGAEQRAKSSFVEREFLNVYLDEAIKSAIKAVKVGLDWYDASLLELADSGYTFSLKWDERNNCHAAWILQQRPDHENFGFILPGRGSTPLKALKQALYIHYELLKGEWSKAAKKPTRDEIDD